MSTCPTCGLVFAKQQDVHPRRECTGSKYPLFDGDTPLTDDEVREMGFVPTANGWERPPAEIIYLHKT